MNATIRAGRAGSHRPRRRRHQAIAACSGAPLETVKALIVANDFLQTQLDELGTKVSTGYARGRLPRARERKDEADV